MKAVVVEKPYSLKVMDVPVPEISDDEFLVKVRACSICNATDNHIYRGIFEGNNDYYPQVLGHEICGDVVKLGKNVTGVKEGERIACCCDVGGMAEYAKMNRHNIWMRPASHVPDRVATICEMFHGSYTGMIVPANVKKTDNVLIIGQGPMGLTTTALIKTLAGSVSTVDLFENRVEISKKMGADYVYNRSKLTNKGIIENILSSVGQIDIVMMCISEDRSSELDAYDLAVDALKENGGLTSLIVAAKIIKENHRPNMLHIISKNIKVQHFLNMDEDHGCYRGKDFQVAMDMVNDSRIDLSPLITHEITFDEVEHGLDLCWNHLDKTIKVVINLKTNIV